MRILQLVSCHLRLFLHTPSIENKSESKNRQPGQKSGCFKMVTICGGLTVILRTFTCTRRPDTTCTVCNKNMFSQLHVDCSSLVD